MSLLPTHILAIAVASLTVYPAFAQHLTPGMRGVDSAKYFAELCFKTAPSFSDAKAEENRRKSSGQSGIHGAFHTELSFVETETSCSCRVASLVGDSWLSEFTNNFYVTLQRDFTREFQSGSQNPTRMSFEFEGVMTEVTIPAFQRTEVVWQVMPQVTRQGSCPDDE